MKIADIKNILINNGVNEETLKGLNKQQLEDMMSSFEKEIQDFSDKIPPVYGSLEWDSYVMSQLAPHEVVDGNPNINGLRRLAEKLLGPIVDSGPIKVESLIESETTTGRASCVYSVTFSPWMPVGSTPVDTRVFRGAADSFIGNTDAKYAVFPVAMAEVRAEARALKRALQITNVCADELMEKDPEITVEHTFLKNKLLNEKTTTNEYNENDMINNVQKNFIEVKCQQMSIDCQDFINSGKTKYSSIDNISRETASLMIETLSNYQRDQKMIPSSIKLSTKISETETEEKGEK